MRFRVDDYKISHRWLHSAEHNGSVLVPYVTTYYNGGKSWEGASWSLAYHLHRCRTAFGEPTWREPLDIELRLVAVDGGYLKYAIL